MNLHDEIKNNINELQDLLHETDEQAWLDKAREQWGEEDFRYEVLEQFVESSSKFSQQAKPPKPESSGGQDNKPIR